MAGVVIEENFNNLEDLRVSLSRNKCYNEEPFTWGDYQLLFGNNLGLFKESTTGLYSKRDIINKFRRLKEAQGEADKYGISYMYYCFAKEDFACS